MPTAAELIDRLQREDIVVLPTLTREELAVTGSLEASPLRDAAEVTQWNGLHEEARRVATAAALRSLGSRKLIDLSQRPESDASGQVALNTAPELGMILAARRQPSYLAVGSEPRQGLIGFVRLYGVLDEKRKLNIVLLERAAPNGIHEFALCMPAKAASELSRWACGPRVEDNSGKAEAALRTIEVIRPSKTGPLRTRLGVLVTDDATMVADFDERGELTGERPITEPALRERLRAMLTKAGRSSTD